MTDIDIVPRTQAAVARQRVHEAHGWGSAYPYRLIEELVTEIQTLRGRQN